MNSLTARLDAHFAQAKAHPDVAQALAMVAVEVDALNAKFARLVEDAPSVIREYVLTGVTRDSQPEVAPEQARAEAASASAPAGAGEPKPTA